jgi:hypothetical protein
LDVCDSDGTLCFDLLFATVDCSINHLAPELRRSFEDMNAKSASLFESNQRREIELAPGKRNVGAL